MICTVKHLRAAKPLARARSGDTLAPRNHRGLLVVASHCRWHPWSRSTIQNHDKFSCPQASIHFYISKVKSLTGYLLHS